MTLNDARKIKLGATLWVKGRGNGHEPEGWFKVRVTQPDELTEKAPAYETPNGNGIKTHYIWVNTSCGVYSSNRLYACKGE